MHAAKITLLDRQVGRLLHKLEEMGELDNTLVLFTSDNGPHFAAGGHDHEFFDSNGALRGGKRDLYEGGIRVPLLAYWPGRVAAGVTTGHISAFQDFMPTFAEVAGVEVPEQTDGISFLPLLLGEEQREHEALNFEIQLSGWFQTLPDGGFRQSARMGEWKAVRYGVDSPTELYNLNQDISESNDVAADHPDIVETMNRLFESAPHRNARLSIRWCGAASHVAGPVSGGLAPDSPVSRDFRKVEDRRCQSVFLFFRFRSRYCLP